MHVFGHTNPDTDAITAAIVYTHLLNRQGQEAQAFRLGEPNFETKYVLSQLGIDPPPLLPELAAGSEVVLVDHNESGQSVPNLAELKVKRVVDHHKLGDLTTADPPYLRFEPVGCTATLLLKLHREAGLSVEKQDAQLMLSAILSDTLHFRSPTTTQEERDAVEFLAPIAGISNVEEYALAMFAAKSDLGDTPAETLLKMDYKVFPFGDSAQPQRWGIGVIETTNPGYVFGRQGELLAAMEQVKGEDKLTGILLCVVDILQGTNKTFVLGDTEVQVIKGAFGADTQAQVADLGDRISRKKQIVPTLEKYFAG